MASDARSIGKVVATRETPIESLFAVTADQGCCGSYGRLINLVHLMFASHSSGLAGAERSLIELVRSSVRMGHQVTVALPGDGPLHDVMYVEAGVDAVRVRARNWIGARAQGLVGVARILQAMVDVFPALRLLRRTNPDLVVVNSLVAPVFMFASRLAGIPLVVILRESLGDNVELRCALPFTAVRRLISWCSGSRVVAVSEFVARRWKDAAVVWPPVKVGDWSGPARTTPGADGRIRVVMVGTVSSEKGQFELMKALEHPALRSGLEVRIVGGGRPGDVRKLEALVASYDSEHVTYIGESLDVASHLGWADLSVVCSHAEAFGKVTVESLLAGVPVLGYAAGGTREIGTRFRGVALISPDWVVLQESLLEFVRDPSGLVKAATTIDRQELVDEFSGLAETAVRTCLRLAGLRGGE
jgi:glycosyltransferase involved in cell wall biosynthesis